jgi:prephenate dehydrogenase
VLANLLVNQAGATNVEGHDPLLSGGGSLRDMTRVAGANPRIWVDIFLDNSGPLRASLAEHRRLIERLEQALEVGDAGFLGRWIGEAAGNRRRLLEVAYPDPGALHRLRVHVPDRPGIMAAITQALGVERINIEDFELQHLTPERGGVLMLLVTGERQAQRAAELLEAQGYGVVLSPVLDE